MPTKTGIRPLSHGIHSLGCLVFSTEDARHRQG
jgi:hypothetical protein